MTARRIRVERLIAVLGVAVVLLGAALLWLATRAGGLGGREPSPEERAGVQLREHVGPAAVVRYTERGRRRAVCGYVSADDRLEVFISRPNRILLESDPLKVEFDEMLRDVCPGFLTRAPNGPGGAPMTDRPTAGRFEGREHRLPVRVYYEDTDFTGLVYHANYVRYFERGRSDALRLMGIGHAELLDGDQPLAFVVTKMDLTFLKPARIDDELVVRTRYEAVRGPRLIISQTISRGADDLCGAGVEVACIHMDGRPRRPSVLLRDKVGPWLTGEP